jgi:hypothetical protein
VALVSEGSDADCFLKLVPAAQLLREPLDEAMRDYVDQMAAYADIAVGSGWRDAAQATG